MDWQKGKLNDDYCTILVPSVERWWVRLPVERLEREVEEAEFAQEMDTVASHVRGTAWSRCPCCRGEALTTVECSCEKTGAPSVGFSNSSVGFSNSEVTADLGRRYWYDGQDGVGSRSKGKIGKMAIARIGNCSEECWMVARYIPVADSCWYLAENKKIL